MAKSAPTADIDESKLRVSAPATEAVGVPAVMHALEMSIEQMGLVRSARTLLRVNQKDVRPLDCSAS